MVNAITGSPYAQEMRSGTHSTGVWVGPGPV